MISREDLISVYVKGKIILRFIGKYIFNILIAIDQLANALIGGDPDETISSRCGKYKNKCILCKILCKILDKIDYRHCEEAIEPDEGKEDLIFR